jgi:uncharacterized protein
MFYGKIKANPSLVSVGIWKWSLVVLCLFVLGCSSSTSASTPNTSTPDVSTPMTEPSTPTSVMSGPGQVLPITAEAIMAGQVVQLEVALTPEQQSLGLMYRTYLADNQGMLFPFAGPRRTAFWMKNVPIALDMVFLLDGRVQGIAANALPCEVEPCPIYRPGNLLVDQVIELRGGRAAELGLQPGDRVEIRTLTP